MSPFTVPVPMLVSKGGGAALAVSVFGLLMMLVLASKNDPTVRNQRV